MISAARGRGPIGAVLTTLALACGCTGPVPQSRPPVSPVSPVSRVAVSRVAVSRAPGAARARPVAARLAVGISNSYRVGQRQVTFVEPPHIGPTGQHLGPRELLTAIRYPLSARGQFPLLLFAPGFMQCGGPYSDLLQAWASAGYVVAVVDFPRTDCRVGAAADEADLVNQPADMSYVLTQLLTLNARPDDPFAGLLNPHQIAAAGQSDGGDTVAAAAASGCCTDHRLAAMAVLSGSEWPAMPGGYFRHGAPPMLFVQGSADTINPPSASLRLYQADRAGHRYYLNLLGANHIVPYWGTNPMERIVARVTLAFFDRYVLGRSGALAAMSRYGNITGSAALVTGGSLPPGA